MIPRPVPSRPWQSFSADLFQVQGKESLWLLTINSNFFEVDKLHTQTSKEVIEKLKCPKAWKRIPDQLWSDNGLSFCYAFEATS